MKTSSVVGPVLLLVFMLAGTSLLLWRAAPMRSEERGGRLFNGGMPLVGRIAGHAEALPFEAARCINCHSGAAVDSRQRSARPGAVPGAASAPFAPALTRSRLREMVARRSGPPSRFDEASLCRLLKTGVDPAFIVIAQVMPRYEMTDADCGSLWRYMIRDEK